MGLKRPKCHLPLGSEKIYETQRKEVMRSRMYFE